MNLALTKHQEEEQLYIQSMLREHNKYWKSKMYPGWTESVVERRKLVFSMRKTGLGYAEISQETGISKATIMNDINAVLEEYRQEMLTDAHLLVVQELERIDTLQNAFWERSMQGSDKAAAIVIKCMQERRALLGLGIDNRIKNDKDIIEKNTIVVQYVSDWRNPNLPSPDAVTEATPDENILDVVPSDRY